jgi:hypothetical protein
MKPDPKSWESSFSSSYESEFFFLPSLIFKDYEKLFS